MSMDDPGWGEEVPADSASGRGSGSPLGKGGPSGPSGISRNVLIGGGAVVVVIIIVVIVLVASGSSKKTATSTTTTTTAPKAVTTTTVGLAKYGTAYLAMESPAYSALSAFGTTVSGWDANPPTAIAAQQAADPVVNQFKLFQGKLLATTWPTAVQPNANALASQVGVVSNDLEGLSLAFQQNGQAAWGTQFTTDANALVADVNTVRGQLGLPKLPTS